MIDGDDDDDDGGSESFVRFGFMRMCVGKCSVERDCFLDALQCCTQLQCCSVGMNRLIC